MLDSWVGIVWGDVWRSALLVVSVWEAAFFLMSFRMPARLKLHDAVVAGDTTER
jgi:hypothetical protein